MLVVLYSKSARGRQEVLPKVIFAYTTLPSAHGVRSHLPFQGRYNRLDLKLQFAITTNLYMLPERELAKSRSDFD